MDAYNVGNGLKQILLAADIDTIGLATSRAIIVHAGTGAAVAHSVDATGDISLQQIGTAATLQGKRLSIFTRVDLLGNDLDERKKAYDNLAGSYTLQEGADGNKVFSGAETRVVDENYLTAFLNELIDLV